MISGTTGLIGLLGQPVSHSLSPVMHNAALKAMDLDWRYLALPCRADDLKTVLNGLQAVGCRGLNVTIPHKQQVVGLCRELSPLAERLGAVNTLTPFKEGGWHGHNTDMEGFLAPLQMQAEQWQDAEAVVLGCGGSARAVVAGLQQLPLTAIHVAGRRSGALDDFLNDLRAGQSSDSAPLIAMSFDPDALSRVLQRSKLVVNTTPVGMQGHGDDNAMPLGSDLWAGVDASVTLYDLIYTPRSTPWLALGQQRGCRTIDGLEMLVQQGAAALRRWSGRTDVPVDQMREGALRSLDAHQAQPEGSTN
ncbi:shikimate dehydrogenase [Synechococcus sp. UW179A]|uniref:shikimate dehydrogenase n=1 Tax=Synechococcus sp. UW179A TaxID=2575510 RepID=UPI000E0E66EB|nr:shikimate dehydrogenase [Synechococcus sp. UW179A]